MATLYASTERTRCFDCAFDGWLHFRVAPKKRKFKRNLQCLLDLISFRGIREALDAIKSWGRNFKSFVTTALYVYLSGRGKKNRLAQFEPALESRLHS